jgi:predicted nucleotidyltransferase
MVSLIAAKKIELSQLCKRFHVAKLELFGSATTDHFRPEASDLDFLVEFERGFEGGYFDFLFELESLFGRDVDLVMTAAIRNPYFLRAIAKQRTVLYAA